MTLTRDRALALVHEYTASDALRKHMYAVEIAMRAMAGRAGEDPDAWGVVGLLHDFDYERFPNAAHAPDAEHPARASASWPRLGAPEDWQQAILGHAAYTGVPRDHPDGPRPLCRGRTLRVPRGLCAGPPLPLAWPTSSRRASSRSSRTRPLPGG